MRASSLAGLVLAPLAVTGMAVSSASASSASAVAVAVAVPDPVSTTRPQLTAEQAAQLTPADYFGDWKPRPVKPGPAAIINTVPRRYQYSTREHSVNATNVEAALARQGGSDTFTARMYWDSAPTAAPTYPGASCGVR